MIPLKLQPAMHHLLAGHVIAYPTEGVWGFGCDPHNETAVHRLLKLKQRDVRKGLILVGASGEQFAPYLEGLDESFRQKFFRPTASPTTWLVPDNGYAPGWIKGDFSSVALRVSTHSKVIALCRGFNGPIVSSSANIAGQRATLWPWQLHRFLGHGLDCIVPGSLLAPGRPSEIRDLLTDKVLRPA